MTPNRFSRITKDGLGTLVLSGANTFTGPLTVAGGILSVGADANRPPSPGRY